METDTVTKEKDKKNNIPRIKINKRILLIIVGAVLLLLISIFAITFFSSKKSSESNEIVWWGLWEDETIVKSLISDYESKNPKIKIKYVKQSKEDYRERLTNALAKGVGPDMFRIHNSWVPMFQKDLDKMPSSVYSAADFSTQFFPVAMSDLSLENGIVGIPLEYDGIALYINEDIFEKSGKSIPTTWNELRQTARELTIIDENGDITQSGVALGRTENIDHWPEILALMMLQNGVNLENPTGKLAEDALSFFTIFSKSDKIWDTTLPQSTVSFASGKLAMYFGPSWRAFEIRSQNPDLSFKTVPLPQLPKTEKNEPDVSYASYWVEVVCARSKNKSAVWDFLKYLSSDESLNSFYQSASKVRMFGEPYPKISMAESLFNHPIIGSIVKSGNFAQSWYLHTRTWDGPTGINSQINKYFEDAINLVNEGENPSEVLPTVTQGVNQVLSAYGIRTQ